MSFGHVDLTMNERKPEDGGEAGGLDVVARRLAELGPMDWQRHAAELMSSALWEQPGRRAVARVGWLRDGGKKN